MFRSNGPWILSRLHQRGRERERDALFNSGVFRHNHELCFTIILIDWISVSRLLDNLTWQTNSRLQLMKEKKLIVKVFITCGAINILSKVICVYKIKLFWFEDYDVFIILFVRNLKRRESLRRINSRPKIK